MFLNCIFVGAGGFLGSVCRYLVGLIPALHKGILPWQTMFVNIAGAFLIGVIMRTSERCGGMNAHALLLLQVGFCGGFTTFSTFSAETFHLFANGKYGPAILLVVLSVTLCLAGVFTGRWVAGH